MADAEATAIYATAYNQWPEAVDLYDFTRTMQSEESMLAANSTLVLTTDSDLFRFMQSTTARPAGAR